MMRRESTKYKFRGWIEKFFLLAGVIGVGLWLASQVVPAVWQDWENWVFDHELRGETATVKGYAAGKADQIARDLERWLGLTPAARPSIPQRTGPQVRSHALKNHALIGRLTIPRLHLSAIVREGVGQDTLGLAVGHIPGTSLPGQVGNVGVAGHRDTLFLGLKRIEANDLVHFETLEAKYVYQVKSTEVVKPKDVGVLRAGRYPELTLVTCYPFRYIGSAPDRFIVKAREVAQIGLQDGLPEAQAIAQQDVPPPNEGREGGETVTSHAEASGRARTDLERKPGRTEPEGNELAGTKKIDFDIDKNRGRTLVPGVSVGIDDTDAIRQRVTGWVFIGAGRRTIRLRDQRTGDPVIFYSSQDRKRRELLFTNVTDSSATGYLLVSGG